MAELGLVRSRVKQFESRVRLSAQSFSQHVAGVCYSNARPNDSHQMAVCDQGPGKITIKKSKQGSRSADFATCCDYGVLSGIKGQASIIAGRINADTRSVISINGFDDASMWTKDPAPAKDRASGARKEGMHVNGKIWRRGSTISLPVCNNVENLIIRSSSSLSSHPIHSGATVLPQANAATVHRALKDWTMVSPTGSGKKIDPDQLVTVALNATNALTT